MGKNYFSLPLMGLLIAFTAVGFVACGQATTHDASIPSAENSLRGSSSGEKTASGALYALSQVDGQSGTVAVYSGSSVKFVRSFQSGLNVPEQMVFNSRRQLQVTNFSGENVTMYRANGSKPIRTLSEGLKEPTVLAVAPNNDLYVAERSHITIFPNSRQQKVKEIKVRTNGLAIDAANNAYIAQGNEILVYPSGATQPSREITQGIDSATHLLIDSSGNLYAANGPSSACGNVTVYDAETGSLEYTITEGICAPSSMAVDSSGDLFVANNPDTTRGEPSVTEYSAETGALLRTITKGIIEPESLVTDPAGTLYVGNFGGTGFKGNVSVYPVGQTSPSETLTKQISRLVDLVWLPKP